jgi:hypothetical protein
MKTLKIIAFLSFLMIPLYSGAQDTLNMAEKSRDLTIEDIKGSWTIFQITYITRDGVKKMTETQMKSSRAFADYFFMDDGKFKQISNMTETTETETQLGTWRIKGNKLFITLKIDNQMKELGWDMDYKYGTLNLSRSSPDDALKIINSFRKK